VSPPSSSIAAFVGTAGSNLAFLLGLSSTSSVVGVVGVVGGQFSFCEFCELLSCGCEDVGAAGAEDVGTAGSAALVCFLLGGIFFDQCL
jgi:hypothetical protein